MKLLNTFIGLSFLASLAACTKSNNNDANNNNNNNGNSTPSQLLVAGKWQMIAGTATTKYMGKDTTVDVYAETDDCDKDDFILFASNGTGTIDENTNKCADDQQVESFTWALLNNNTRLAVVDSNPDTMDVQELTATEMKLKEVSNNSSGTPIITVVTYKNIK
ncbi:MAG: lipocalin family protein [Bacteroidetes bacterium]|nr:lipocalin family protein [Bacteroidota bacterium]